MLVSYAFHGSTQSIHLTNNPYFKLVTIVSAKYSFLIYFFYPRVAIRPICYNRLNFYCLIDPQFYTM